MDELESLVRIATGGVRPDVTFLLDVPASVGLRRLQGGAEGGAATSNQITFFEELEMPEDWNRFEDEGRAFQERVRGAYLELVQREPSRWRTIDASRPVEDVANDILSAVVRVIEAPALSS
jgi:dTMP kinase